MGTPWERADVEREHIENTSATVTPREHLGSLRKNGITGTRWARKHRGNAVGMPWAWDSGNALKAWRRPWEHLGNALGMGTHWEHLGNGLTLNGNSLITGTPGEGLGNTANWSLEFRVYGLGCNKYRQSREMGLMLLRAAYYRGNGDLL